jgi:hypothetical protein
LPSLSVTETVTGRPIEAAVETACEITCCTSDAVKLCGKTGETVNRSITKGTDHALVVRRRSFFMMSKEYHINRGISQAFGPSGWSADSAPALISHIVEIVRIKPFIGRVGFLVLFFQIELDRVEPYDY